MFYCFSNDDCYSDKSVLLLSEPMIFRLFAEFPELPTLYYP